MFIKYICKKSFWGTMNSKFWDFLHCDGFSKCPTKNIYYFFNEGKKHKCYFSKN